MELQKLIGTDSLEQGWLPHHFCGVTTDQHGGQQDKENDHIMLSMGAAGVLRGIGQSNKYYLVYNNLKHLF